MDKLCLDIFFIFESYGYVVGVYGMFFEIIDGG